MSVLGACVNEPFEDCSFHTRLGGVDLLERSVWNQCFLFLLRRLGGCLLSVLVLFVLAFP